MNVTVLAENTRLAGRDDLRAENGLSLYIQRDEMRILFDTGMTEAFARNAERLGIDIQRCHLPDDVWQGGTIPGARCALGGYGAFGVGGSGALPAVCVVGLARGDGHGFALTYLGWHGINAVSGRSQAGGTDSCEAVSVLEGWMRTVFSDRGFVIRHDSARAGSNRTWPVDRGKSCLKGG